MVRGKALSCDTRDYIIKEYKTGRPYKLISRELALPRSTVHSVIKKFETTGQIYAKKPNHQNRNRGGIKVSKILPQKLEFNEVNQPTKITKKWKNEVQQDVPMTDNWISAPNNFNYHISNAPPFQSIREPEVNIYAEEDKIPQRPGSSLLEEQSFDTESRQDNNENKYQEHHHQTKRRKSKRSSNSKKRAKNSATVQATLDSLQTVTKAISAQHDEFSLFGEYMAMSLRTMPMRNALRCKEKLLSVIVNERLNVGSENI